MLVKVYIISTIFRHPVRRSLDRVGRSPLTTIESGNASYIVGMIVFVGMGIAGDEELLRRVRDQSEAALCPERRG